jgi:hypothetical protein
MSLIHFKYLNEVDKGTVFRYSSQLAGLPATNIQNTVKAKAWRTESDFVVTTYNREFVFRNTATSSVLQFSIPSGTYTGSGLASTIQTNLNSVGNYADHVCNYNSATQIFTFGRSATSTGLFQMVFSNAAYKHNTVAVLTGFENGADYSGSFNYTSTSTFGNEHELIVSFTSTQSVDSLIIDGHNLATGTVIRFRGTKETATIFSGGWNTATGITLSSTIAYNSSIISVEFTATSMKHMQIYWYDRSQRYSQIGRIFAGTYFEPQYRYDNDVLFRKKTILRRTNQQLSYSGVTWCDRRNSVYEYEIGIDPLDPYYNPTTKSTLEAMFDYVGNHTPFWISLNTSLNSNTIYGLLTDDTEYDRLENTPVLLAGTITVREQK